MEDVSGWIYHEWVEFYYKQPREFRRMVVDISPALNMIKEGGYWALYRIPVKNIKSIYDSQYNP